MLPEVTRENVEGLGFGPRSGPRSSALTFDRFPERLLCEANSLSTPRCLCGCSLGMCSFVHSLPQRGSCLNQVFCVLYS